MQVRAVTRYPWWFDSDNVCIPGSTKNNNNVIHMCFYDVEGLLLSTLKPMYFRTNMNHESTQFEDMSDVDSDTREKIEMKNVCVEGLG